MELLLVDGGAELDGLEDGLELLEELAVLDELELKLAGLQVGVGGQYM